jgi:hypothetical protein
MSRVDRTGSATWGSVILYPEVHVNGTKKKTQPALREEVRYTQHEMICHNLPDDRDRYHN